ncbi:alpha-1,2-fucosyltransferase [Malaciobacter marinus]|jgi:glutaredoxin-related protein|uniref:alpha-1,2-fucosyltransferase n=1 Tax=Malaciobacter marinus TaxID=505249 RepID=UPI0009A8ECC0|nr:alpha-1,2-fucosyltransferase [Malaciobacter marinus]SKB26520.1 Glycosyl transferase family 11 [Malaciobacter marinus]
MIISKITGGLGNQMFQYAIAKSIAVKNSDIFKLDITAYETYKLFDYRLNIFNITENIANYDEILNLRGNDNKIFKVLKKLGLYNKPTYYKEKERTIFDKNVFNYKNIYLDGYWQNEKYFIDIRDILLKELTPKEDISEIAKEYLKNIQNTQSISLHVRRGDYLKHPEIGVLDLEYYKKSYEYITREIENPIFYIFSNDLAWCEENFDFIQNKVFVKDTKTEIDDLILMKSCKHNIVANSSFSWWGGWLNENINKIIIAPKQWMAINPKSYKWIPNSWIEV